MQIGQTVIALAVEVDPFTATHVLVTGDYRLTVKLAAANADPVTCTIEITHRGRWFETEEWMRTEGLGLRLVCEGAVRLRPPSDTMPGPGGGGGREAAVTGRISAVFSHYIT
jgi:hypothetical protein